ncbi:unnamed protein product [Larinioides sclopetarius]|uniref:C2H2-type domain-containing protein n=1 Tax=Larinioides sclopetarius TaxID=280406 RepID=A0AAV2BXZ5_9ARAC
MVHMLREESLGAKIAVQDGVLIYYCLQCSYNTPYKWNMKAHKLIHSGERPFVCNVCKKSFNRKGNLKTHLMVHLRDVSQ